MNVFFAISWFLILVLSWLFPGYVEEVTQMPSRYAISLALIFCQLAYLGSRIDKIERGG